jgi:LemA protein
MSIILLAVLIVITFYFIMVYNSLVSIRNNVSKSWANIEVLLKQRNEELPKLVDTCKQYMKHEQETLQKVIRARAQAEEAQQAHDMAALGEAENAIRTGLGSIFALAEAYPELKANQNFSHLQTRITNLENAIADRREFYNDSVYINNVRIQQFPDLIVARLLGFPTFQMLNFSAAELKDVDIGKRFAS